jgi:hypothetical protein
MATRGSFFTSFLGGGRRADLMAVLRRQYAPCFFFFSKELGGEDGAVEGEDAVNMLLLSGFRGGREERGESSPPNLKSQRISPFCEDGGLVVVVLALLCMLSAVQ